MKHVFNFLSCMAAFMLAITPAFAEAGFGKAIPLGPVTYNMDNDRITMCWPKDNENGGPWCYDFRPANYNGTMEACRFSDMNMMLRMEYDDSWLSRVKRITSLGAIYDTAPQGDAGTEAVAALHDCKDGLGFYQGVLCVDFDARGVFDVCGYVTENYKGRRKYRAYDWE